MVTRAALLVTMVLAGGCPKPAPEPPAEPEPEVVPAAWPMFRGRATHTGDFGDRATPAWKLRWTAELGERVDASPLVTNDRRVLIVTRGGTLAALDTRSGADRGRVTLSAGVWSSPAIAGDVVLLATEDGHIVGLDAEDLADRWRRRAPAKSFSGITVAGGVAYVCSGSILLALGPRDGRVHWQVELGAPSFTAPAVSVDERLVVVGTRGGDVLAFDTSGKPRWMARTTAGAHNDGSPVIARNTVLIGSNDRTLHAFGAADGAELWSVSGDHWVVSTPAVASGTVFYGDDGGVLRAVSLATGALEWRAEVGEDLASSPTVVGELVVHGAHDADIHAHRRDGTRSLGPIDAGAPIYASPALALDGTVFVATHEGRVLAIE